MWISHLLSDLCSHHVIAMRTHRHRLVVYNVRHKWHIHVCLHVALKWLKTPNIICVYGVLRTRGATVPDTAVVLVRVTKTSCFFSSSALFLSTFQAFASGGLYEVVA